jgi:hypothetical protein
MAKTIVMVLGVVLVLIGILGFFNNPVLGRFEVDMVHNLVHLLSGVLALVLAAKGEASARAFAKAFGVVYGLVAVLGLVMGTDGKLLGLMEINSADNWLHILLAVILLAVGFMKSSSSPAPMGGNMGGGMGGPGGQSM